MTNKGPSALLEKLADRKATIVIVGLGYVGLPLACALAEAGHHVIGIDTSKKRVDGINQGRSHIEDVPAEQVQRLNESGHLTATTDYNAARVADAAIIAVPTPIDEILRDSALANVLSDEGSIGSALGIFRNNLADTCVARS